MVDLVERLLADELVQQQIPAMPILLEMIDEYKKTKPLEGKTIAFSHVIHPNTVIMIAVIISAGAELEIYTNNGFYQDDHTIDHLKTCGLTVEEDCIGEKIYDYAFDCAGYFLDKNIRIGTVEVTRTGIHKFKDLSRPPYTLIDVDSTNTKILETFLGNPQGMLNALKYYIKDFNNFIKGKNIAIIGFGKIGRGSARIFKEMGNTVIILDNSTNAIEKANHLGYTAFTISDDPEKNSLYLRNIHIAITATGHYGVMTDHFIKKLIDPDIIRLNLGVEDEWGDDYSEQEIFYSKYKPFNFNVSPATPSKYIDPILALQIKGMIYLVETHNTLLKRHYIIPGEFDNEIIKIFNQLYENEGASILEYFDS